jgi:hypothetical protein
MNPFFEFHSKYKLEFRFDKELFFPFRLETAMLHSYQVNPRIGRMSEENQNGAKLVKILPNGTDGAKLVTTNFVTLRHKLTALVMARFLTIISFMPTLLRNCCGLSCG